MSEFETQANVSISVSDSQLRDARKQIEDALSDVSLGLDASPGGVGGGGGSQQRTQSMRLDRTRNELLEEVVRILDDIEDQGGVGGGGDGGSGFNLRRLLKLGALGGAGGLGGIAALTTTLDEFSVPDKIDVVDQSPLGVENIDPLKVEEISPVEQLVELTLGDPTPSQTPAGVSTGVGAGSGQTTGTGTGVGTTNPDATRQPTQPTELPVSGELTDDNIRRLLEEPPSDEESEETSQKIGPEFFAKVGATGGLLAAGGRLASDVGSSALRTGGRITSAAIGLPANVAARVANQNDVGVGNQTRRGSPQLATSGLATASPAFDPASLLQRERNATESVQDFAEGSPAIGNDSGESQSATVETTVNVGAPRIEVDTPQIVDETVSAFESEISDVEQDLQQQIDSLERRIERAAR